MSSLTRSQLKTSSNNTYLTNGIGDITAAEVRTFNDDLIDSLITNDLTASMNVLSSSYAVTASFALNTVAQIPLTSLNAYTASQDTKNSTLGTYTGSIDTKWNTLGGQTGSFVTETESGSFLITASVNLNTITFTKGNNTTFAITVNTGSATSTDLTSLNAYTASQDTKNLAVGYSTSSLNSFTASNANTSLNSYTASNDTKWSNLGSQSGSFITESETGSFARTNVDNNFSVNQTFTNITAVSASFQYVQTTYETSSVIYSSGSNQFGDAIDDVQTLIGTVIVSGSQKITGSLDVSSTFTSSLQSGYVLVGNGSGRTIAVPTSSVGTVTDLTSLNAYTASQDTKNSTLATYTASVDSKFTAVGYSTASLNTFTSSQNTINTNVSASSSLYETKFATIGGQSGSWGGSTIPAGTISSSAQITSLGFVSSSVTASSLVTASFAGNTLTFTKGDASTFGVVIPDVSGSAGTTIYDTVYTGESITKGDPLYISGSQGANPIVFKADAAIAAKMPVTYVSNETIGAGTTTEAIILGHIEGIDLTGYTAGQTIYVAEGGGWSTSLPSGSNSVTQLLGVVTKGGSGGKGLVLNPGPAQLPGLDTGKMWVGGSTNQPVEITSASFASSASFNSYTSSTDSRLTNIESTTSSLNNSVSLLNSYTASNDTKWNTLSNVSSSLIQATGSYAVKNATNVFTAIQSFSASLEITGSSPNIKSGSFSGSLITNLTDVYTDVSAVNQIVTLTSASYAGLLSGSLTNPNTLYIVSGSTASGGTTDISSLNAFTASQETKNSTLATYTASVDTKFTAIGISTASLNTATASLFTSASLALVTSSVAGNVLTFRKGDNTTFSLTIETGSAGSPFPFNGNAVITGSLLVSGSTSSDITIGKYAAGAGIRISSSKANSAYSDGIIVTPHSINTTYLDTPSALKVFAEKFTRILSAPDTGSSPTLTNNFNITRVSDSAILGEWTLVGYGTDISNSGNAGGIYIGKGQPDSSTTRRHTIGFNYIPPTTSEAYNFVFAGQSTYDKLQGGARTGMLGHLFVSQSFTASIQEGYTWVGNSTGYGVPTPTSSFGGGGATDISSLNAYTASQDTKNSTLSTYTASVDTKFTTLGTQTGSFVTETESGSFLITASFSGNTLTFTKGNNTTFGVVIPDVSGSTINTGSFATTGSNAFFGTNTFSGAVAFTGSAPTILSSSFSGSIITNLTDTYTDVAAVNQIVTLTSASYAALASGSLTNSNTLYIVSGSTSGSITSATLGSNTFSGSQIFTGSVRGNVVSMSIASATSSLDLNAGNYFTLSIPTGTTRISPSNIQAGTSATLVITTASGSLVTFDSSVKQPSGSAYVPTSGSVDVLSFVSVNSNTLYVVSTKNMI